MNSTLSVSIKSELSDLATNQKYTFSQLLKYIESKSNDLLNGELFDYCKSLYKK